jgi:ribosomal protein S12 methylthiotransferase
MRRKVNIITLGCSKNLVDSEVLMRQLDATGINVVHDADLDNTDTVVLNTCGFIHDAKQESIDTILNYIQAKEDGLINELFVMGCLSERFKDELAREIPEVDKYFGVTDIQEITESLKVDFKKELLGERMITTPSHFAYLKIAEGCDRTCSFCAIPAIRGPHKSRTVESLVEEAQFLADKGVKELILIAQDLTYYGLDLYKSQELPRLVRELCSVKGIEWIRLHYAYPAKFPMELLQVMREEPKVCNYIDIPFQHINDQVLDKMRRVISTEQTKQLIEQLRLQVPELAIRTTMLVGHPGEDDQAFEELKAFVKEARFDRLGVFTYSEEEGTWGAENLKDDIDEKLKQARADELMLLQQEISASLNLSKIGRQFKVVIDRSEDDYYVGRTEYDSPEVDTEVLIKKAENVLQIGNFYNILIDSADDFDLFGKVI